MRRYRDVLVLVLVLGATAAGAQKTPNFSGSWKWDGTETEEMARTSGRSAVAIMAQSFVAEQSEAMLALHIDFGADTVHANYRLDGTETMNVSPGDVQVYSKCKWEGDKLLIVTTSTAGEGPNTHKVESRRLLWLTADGLLVIDRDGTPKAEVPSSRSVYRKAK